MYISGKIRTNINSILVGSWKLFPSNIWHILNQLPCKSSIHSSTNLSAASTAESNTSSLHGLMSQKAPPQPNRSKQEYRTWRFSGVQQFTMAQTQRDGPSSCCCTTWGRIVVVGGGGVCRAGGARVGFGRPEFCDSMFVLPECGKGDQGIVELMILKGIEWCSGGAGWLVELFQGTRQ